MKLPFGLFKKKTKNKNTWGNYRFAKKKKKKKITQPEQN